jgi:hypothetical protein
VDDHGRTLSWGPPPAPPKPSHGKKWYRKKRYAIPLVCVLTVAVLSAADSDRRRSERAGTARTACVEGYPDQQTSDVCADASGLLRLADMEVTARDLRRSAGVLGTELCVDVAMRNLGPKSKDFSAWDFRLQTPRGEVKSFEWTAQSTLPRGVVVAGGRTSGRVCFSDAADATGRFVLIYKPNAFARARGTWVLPL